MPMSQPSGRNNTTKKQQKQQQLPQRMLADDGLSSSQLRHMRSCDERWEGIKYKAVLQHGQSLSHSPS